MTENSAPIAAPASWTEEQLQKAGESVIADVLAGEDERVAMRTALAWLNAAPGADLKDRLAKTSAQLQLRVQMTDALEAELSRLRSTPAAGWRPNPRPMETAQKDGEMLRLLVEFTEHPLADDDTEPQWTIGFNNLSNTTEDRWQFAGWCWTQDHLTEGEGTVIGWLPFFDDAAPSQPEAAEMPGRAALTTEELTKLADDVDNNRHLNGRQREYLLALLSPSAKES